MYGFEGEGEGVHVRCTGGTEGHSIYMCIGDVKGKKVCSEGESTARARTGAWACDRTRRCASIVQDMYASSSTSILL